MARTGTFSAPWWLVPTALLVALGAGAGSGAAATSSTVVGAAVPSATAIDVAGCPALAAGVTSFGTVTPGSSTRTTADCTVTFGSSNDTARLRVAQHDSAGTAMGRVAWDSGTSGVSSDIRRIDMVDDQVGYAVSTARVLKTLDGGATWAVINLPADSDPVYRGVEAVDADDVWISGSGGEIWRSTDGGSSWTQQAVGFTTTTLDEIEVSGQLVYLGGQLGTVMWSRDGGSSWSQIDSGAGDVNDVAIISDDIVIAVGVAGLVRRSTDGGATWSTAHDASGILETADVAADGSVWVGGASGRLLRSVDDGATWTSRAITTASRIEGVHAFDERTAVAVGRTPSGAWSTVDGGLTWTVEATGAVGDQFAVSGASLETLVVTAAVGEVRRVMLDEPVADLVDGTTDWDQGANAFGACLRAIGAGTSTDGTTWTPDAAGTSGDCDAVDTDPWNPIGPTPASVALSASGVDTASASLRFGLRTASAQGAGRYLAHVRFEVVAPG